jgi:hypothetical protein
LGASGTLNALRPLWPNGTLGTISSGRAGDALCSDAALGALWPYGTLRAVSPLGALGAGEAPWPLRAYAAAAGRLPRILVADRSRAVHRGCTRSPDDF